MPEDRPAFDLHLCLGAGGYGEVYLATQHLQGGGKRRVAVKVLREIDENSEAVKRMRDEGQMLALLNHPTILQVHQFTRVDGRLALVTEYVEGTDLATFCKPPLLHPRVVFAIVAEVASAVDFAWRMPNPRTSKPFRIIHRDIKPDNIRISREGEVRVLDYGIAKSGDMKRHAKTAAGSVLMTPGYGAPESLTFGVSSNSVDVYALGATLFELLTGEKLFQGKPLAYQATLAMDTVDYQHFVAQRLELITLEPARGLLEGLFQHAPERRPAAQHVADFCEDMVDWLEGPTLRQWASRYAFPEVKGVPTSHDLTGRSVSKSGLLGTSGPQLRAPVTQEQDGVHTPSRPAPRAPTPNHPPTRGRRQAQAPAQTPASPPPTPGLRPPPVQAASAPPAQRTVTPQSPSPPASEASTTSGSGSWLLIGVAAALAVGVLLLGASALVVAVTLLL